MAWPRAVRGFLWFWKPWPSAYTWLLSSVPPPATAPQQEADAEVNTETLNKSSGTQAAPTDAASTSKDKEPSTEKSKDSGSVSKLLAFGQ